MIQADVKFAQPRLHPAIIFRAICLGLIVGFIVGFWFEFAWWLVMSTILIMLIFVWLREIPLLLGFLLIGFLLALWRGNGLIAEPPEQAFIGSQKFTGQIVELPRLSERTRRYVVEPINDKSFRLMIISSTWPEYSYGDILRFNCPAVKIIDFKPYNNRGLWRECAFPEIEFIRSDKNSLRYWLYIVRQQAGHRLRSLTPEPYATLATGMMWGDDSGLPLELVNNFRRTGTTHLLAVSGFNVMVLTKILFWFFIALGLWRRQASVIVLIAVALFIVFCGGEPSVVRAGVMGSVLLIGNLLSRPANNFNLLAGTAAIMLFVSPQLIVDLGWQLSFSAMVGLAYLSPLFIKKFNWLPQFLGLKQASAETLSATLTTTPIILWRLSEVSAITPLVNLLVAPVAIMVYFLGLALLVLSTLSFISVMPVVWLLSAVLFYLTTVVNLFATLPWATVRVGGMTWFWLIVCYIILAIWLLAPTKNVKMKKLL